MKGKPQTIVLLYLIISMGWLLASDYMAAVVSFITGIPEYILQSAKGICFISVTSWLLYIAIRKQQKTLLNLAEQYKSLFHSNVNPLWIYDMNTLEFVEVNNAAIRVYGYSREEFKRMTILDIRPKEDAQKVKESLNSLSDDYHFSGNWRHIKKNGEGMAVAVTSHKIKFNNRDCVMVMALNITLQLRQKQRLKKAYKVERALKEELEKNIELIRQSLESKQRLTEVVDRINNMVVVSDSSGMVTWVNQAFEDFTGYTLKEVMGRPYDFLHGPKTDLGVLPGIQESIRSSGFATAEFLHYTKSGLEYWVDVSISAIYNEKKAMERYIAIHNIITERKMREEQLLEQNRILSKHSWTISHSLRKPVASILGLVSLSKEVQQIEEFKQIHSLIEVASLELDEIVKDIGKEINTYQENFN